MSDSQRPVVVLCSARREAAERDRRLAARLELPCVGPGLVPDGALVLATHEGRLEIREPGDRPGRGVSVSIDVAALLPHRGGLGRRQPLARAIGRNTRAVVDATAGLGGDTLLLAATGRSVTAIERHPVVGALLEDGLARATEALRAAGTALDVSLVTGDACAILPTLDPPPEAVYLDPMYPPKRKSSALAKRSVRLLRDLVGDDPDAAQLLDVARAAATGRAVVKRPVHAEPLAPDPDLHFDGKLARYDVYFT